MLVVYALAFIGLFSILVFTYNLARNFLQSIEDGNIHVAEIDEE